MKKIILSILLGVSVFAISCKNNKEFSISGKVENAGDIKKVLLYETDQLIDSAFLNESSEFKFRRVSSDANFYTMAIGEKNFLIVAKNGDELDFHTNYADTTDTYSIKGSEDSEKIRDFNKISNEFGQIYKQIQSDYTNLMNQNPAAKDSIYNALMPKFQANMDKYSAMAFKFVQDNKDNLAGFFAAGTMDQNKYEKELISYAEEIKPKFPNNKAVQSFVTKMMQIKPVSVGQMAPDFELPDPAGKPIKLSDLKGKYILLDFWASWCAPCREENPNIVKQYNTYKDKGFTILGVSLDDDKGAWMKAIEDDKLSWAHVSDLKRWDSQVANQFRVEGIPASFILDPTGKIVAKNLRGSDLQQFLAKALN